MPKLLSTTSLTTILSVGLSFTVAAGAYAEEGTVSPNDGDRTYTGIITEDSYTVINLVGNTSDLLTIRGSSITSGDKGVDDTSSNGILQTTGTLAELTFNGNNFLYATEQEHTYIPLGGSGEVTKNVGGEITINATDFKVLGSSDEFTTTLRVDSVINENVDSSLITLNTGDITIHNAVLDLDGNATVSASDKITMQNGAKLSFSSGTKASSVSATNGFDFYENGTIENDTDYRVYLAGSLNAKTNGDLNARTSFNGGFSVDGAVNIDAGSTMLFNNVIFKSDALTDAGTLDLTGAAVFEKAMTFNDGGTTYFHDTTAVNAVGETGVTFIVPTAYVTTSEWLFKGTNTINIPTDDTSGLGVTLNDENSVLRVENGTTTINGKTTLTAGTLEVDEGTLNLTSFVYNDGYITLGKGAALNLVTDAIINQNVDVTAGTIGLTGGSTVQLNNSDMDFTNATLSAQGMNNQIKNNGNGSVNIGEGATLSVKAPSSSGSGSYSGSLIGGSTSSSSTINSEAYITSDLNVAGGAVNVDSVSRLVVKNMNYRTSDSGMSSSFSNSGEFEVKDGTAIFSQAADFSDGTTILDNATLAVAGSTFSGTKVRLLNDNEVTTTFNMTAGTITAVGTGSTTFDDDASITADLNIPNNYTVTALKGFAYDGSLSNNGLLVLNGVSSFAQAQTIKTGIIRLTGGADVTFSQPATLTTAGRLEVADDTSAIIRGTFNFADGSGIYMGDTNTTLTLMGNANVFGTANIYKGNATSGYTDVGTLTVAQNGYLNLPSNAVLNADVNMATGSYLNVAVTGDSIDNLTNGFVNGTLTGVNADNEEAGKVGFNIPSSLVSDSGTEVHIANANAGSIGFDDSNILYSFAWKDGGIGTAVVTRKNINDVAKSLRERTGSTYNQSETIAGTLAREIPSDRAILRAVADNMAADIQAGRISSANKNADLLDPNQAPMAIAVSTANTDRIHSAVSERFLSSSSRDRRKIARAARASNTEDLRQSDNPYMRRYYEQKNQQRTSYNSLFDDEVIRSSYTDELTGMSAGDVTKGKMSLWVQGLYSKGKIDKKDDIPGFDLSGWGAAIGFDYAFNNMKVGIGYAYTHNETESDGRDGEVDGHTGFVYGEFMPNNWYVNGMLAYTFSSYEETKKPYGIAIKSDYDGKSIAAEAMTGYSFGAVAPEIGLRYIRASIDDYTDSAGQKISVNDSSVWTAIAGIKGTIAEIFNWRLAATYDINQSSASTVVLLPNNVSYKLKSSKMKKLGAEFGAGISFGFFTIAYEGALRDGYQNHTGLLQLRYQW